MIKYIWKRLQVRHFRHSRKTLKYENCLNFEKTNFWCLGFSSHLSTLLYLELWFKQMYTDDLFKQMPFVLSNAQTPAPFIKCRTHWSKLEDIYSTTLLVFFLEQTTVRKIGLLFLVLRYPAQCTGLQLSLEPLQNKFC